MGWLIAAAVLVMIALLPLSLCFCYDESGFSGWLSIWPLRIFLFPGKKRKKGKPRSSKPSQYGTGKKNPQSKGGKFSAFLPYVQNVLEFLAELRVRLVVRRLELTVILTDPDPCDLAVNYGRAWAVLGNLVPRLESIFQIRKRDLAVECDFVGEETTVYFYMDVSVTIGRLLYMTIFHGSRILRKYISILNKERAEYKHE